MWAFIGVLSLLAAIVFVVLGVAFKVKKKPTAKRHFMIAGATFILFIIAMIASPSADEDADASSTPSPTSTTVSAPVNEKEDQKSDEKATEEAKKNDPVERMKKAVGKHFDSAEVSFNNDTGHLLIKAPGSDNLTKSMMKKGMWMDATDTLKDLRDASEIKSVDFNITFNMVDKYGNESQEVVMKIGLTAETLAKINWDNFSWSNLPDIADSYWEHPAFSN